MTDDVVINVTVLALMCVGIYFLGALAVWLGKLLIRLGRKEK